MVDAVSFLQAEDRLEGQSNAVFATAQHWIISS
jgi:hypothetical protein